MTLHTLKLETNEHLASLSLNRPQSANSITPQFMDELGAACDQLAKEPSTRVVIITASGRNFCSGLDLDVLGQLGTSISPEELPGLITRWQAVFTALENLPQLTIAAVNGPTLGAGVELILACDFRIASTRALFGLPELQFGIIPDLGGLSRLARIVGLAHAKEIVFRGRNLNPMEALRMGLVNRVTDPGDLMGTAKKWANQFAGLAPRAVRQAKWLLNDSIASEIATSLQKANAVQLELLASDEFRAAAKALRELRTRPAQAGEPPPPLEE